MRSLTVSQFRTLGHIEAISALVLFFIAMPLKYAAGYPLAVRWVGSIHGILFVAYVAGSVVMAGDHKWPFSKVIFSWIVATIPFGPFIFDKKLFPNFGTTPNS